MKQSIGYIPRLLGLSALLLLAGCASSGSNMPHEIANAEGAAPGKIRFASPSRPASTGDETSDGHGQSLSLRRDGFSFRTPDPSWGLVSDPTDESAPLEFFQASTGLRAVLSSIVTPPDEAGALGDRAQIEMQSLKNPGAKVKISEIFPSSVADLDGMGWFLSTQQDGAQFQATGMVAQIGDRLFLLHVSGQDNTMGRDAFAQTWRSFFAGLRVDASLKEAGGPTIGPENVQSHASAPLGYNWQTTDTLWHHWLGVASANSDPDLLLTNVNEEASLFVYGATLDPNEISGQDLFQVFLVRIGLEANPATLTVNRKGTQEKFTQDFSVTRVVGGFDFRYQGRFFWDNGRGIMVVGWTQGVLADKYAKIIQRAIDGVELRPGTARIFDPRLQQFNARVVNQVGLLRLADNQPILALAFFEKANRMDPNEPLYLINCGFVYQLKALYGPGVSHFGTQMELVRKSGKLLAILGEMHESLYDYGAARKYYEMALQYTPNDPELIINLSDALWGLGQRSQSLEVVQRLYDKQPSARLGVYVSKTLMGINQYAEAVDLLYNVRKRFGMTRDLGLALIDALTFLNRHDEALAISEEMLAFAGSDWEVWTARGKSLFYTRNFRKAEAALNKAVALKADNDDAKSFLSATQAFLGKADVRALQKNIDPADPRPSDLTTLIDPALRDSARAEESPAVVHWQLETLKAAKGTPWVRTQQFLMEILDNRGAGLYGEFTFDFLPGHDRLFVNALEVYGPDLKLKTRWNVQQAYITYATEKSQNNEAQTAHLPLPDLKPGDFVYLQVSRTSIENTGAIPYTDYQSSREVPVGLTTLRIYADTTRFRTEEYGGLEGKAIAGGMEWSMRHPVTVRQELYMPSYRDFGAGLLIAGRQTWEEVGNEYQLMIQHQYKNAVPVREKAFEVKGTKVGANAIYALADWVRDNIKYRDVRFGGHSLIPQTAQFTLQERQGDCKDQSLLLQEMLSAAGIRSQLALIHLSDAGSEALATIQQFNHVILHVPASKDNPELWIDPTDKAGNRRPVPLDLEGRVVLVVQGDSSYSTITPILEDDQEHAAVLDHRLFIDSSGSAEFRDSVALTGKFASALRNELLSRDAKEQQKFFGDWIAQGIPDAIVTTYNAENILDFKKPLVLILSYGSKHYFGQSTQGVKGRFPDLWERNFMKLPRVRKRHHPLRLPHETRFESTLSVATNAGVTLRLHTDGNDNSEFHYLEVQKGPNTAEKSRAKTSIAWKTLALYADASEYENVREEWERVLQYTHPEITVHP